MDDNNEVKFLKVLKYEFQKPTENKVRIRNMAYTMISDLLAKGIISSSELIPFNRLDNRLSADTIRYQNNKNKRASK